MQKFSLKPIIAMIGLALLAGCVETPLPRYEKPVNYAGMPTITFDVAEKLLINDSVMSDEAKRLSKAYGTDAPKVIQEWLNERIASGGQRGSFYVILKDASIGRAELPTTGGIQGYFKREQAAKLIGHMEVLFSIEGSIQELPPAEATIKVSASETIPEDASAYERERAYKSLLNRMVSSMNAEAEKQFENYFKGYRL